MKLLSKSNSFVKLQIAYALCRISKPKREQRKDEALLASLGVATDVETLIVN